QRRLVAHEPNVAEGIDESSLAMRSPRHLMILDVGQTTFRTRRQCPRDQRIRIVAKYFDAGRSRTQLFGNLPTVPGRLAHKKRRAGNLQTGDRAQAPEFRRAERLLVPSDSRLSIRDREHHRDRRAMYLRRHHCPVYGNCFFGIFSATVPATVTMSYFPW